MQIFFRRLSLAALAAAAFLPATAQTPPSQPDLFQNPVQLPAGSIQPSQLSAESSTATAIAPITPAMQLLLRFKDSDVKFSIAELMEILCDRRHEGWVLAAYPDPRTADPLIGAGFSLDLPARGHPQTDPLNLNLFIEPSSDELWRAAGLDPARLRTILDRFGIRIAEWKKRGFRRRMGGLDPDISDSDSDLLLRIAIIQSIDNAKAYCRNFDALTEPQQMALTQLVYQMGINLQHFTQFLALINSDATVEAAYWNDLQTSLEQSQWARLYRIRATAVIAMLYPRYANDPSAAETRVGAILQPAVAHYRRSHGRARTELASNQTITRTGRSAAHHGKSRHVRTGQTT